jgi:Transglutaminase-like superfamily
MARLRLIRRLLLRFTQIDNRRRAMLAEAALGLLAARLAVAFVSFSQLTRRFGTMVPPSDPRAADAGISAHFDQMHIANDVSWAVTRAARYMPFKAACLQQAIAAHHMLKRRDVASIVHFGAGKGQTKLLDAHAWLDAAGVEVTGYPVEQGLAEIACFV